MDKVLKAIQNGIYILVETDIKNEFILYRKDYKLLDNNLGNIPIEMCQEFILEYGNGTAENYAVYYELSSDRKCIKVTAKKIVNIKTLNILYH